MESRKRKASNATPSSTDGSASKKLRLLVCILFSYWIVLSRIASPEYLERAEVDMAHAQHVPDLGS